jgi:uncharacterized membrane protein HdeD (DUF308 family)
MSNSLRFELANPPDDRRIGRLLWWLALGAALASVILGILILVWPDETLKVGAALFGLWLVVHGVIHVVRAIMSSGADGGVRALDAIVGVLFIVGGVICLRNLLVSLFVVATIIGVTWLIGGLVGVVSAFSSRYERTERWLAGGLGAISVLGGLIVLLWPGLTLLALVYFTGIWLVVLGLVQVFLVFRTRRALMA